VRFPETVSERDRTGTSSRATPLEVRAGCLGAWDLAELPEPPSARWTLRSVVGPGLMMTGAAIGGGEWLTGPALTAQYGGALLWIGTLSILLQVAYNLEIMRYTLYCGEPIFVGFFRLWPGPRFWAFVYLALDFAALWPYLSANAAVTLVAVALGRLPEDTAADRFLMNSTAYGVFLATFIPLAVGGTIYNSLEKLMAAKVAFVLGYLSFLCLAYAGLDSWIEVFTGLFRFGSLPQVDSSQLTWAELINAWLARWNFQPANSSQGLDLSMVATLAAIAGVGGLNNLSLSAYTREKGWGMGQLVGAIPSAIGGRKIELAHRGKVFPITEESLRRWRGWRWVTIRDQLGIWAIGCALGLAIPALVAYEFVRGRSVPRDALAAAAAEGMVQRTGVVAFWYLTLFCGFLILATGQITTMDGVFRRWTDILWTALPRLQKLRGDKVKYVYYTIMACYAVWGLCALTLIPSPRVILATAGILMNVALGFSSFHTLAVNCRLLPPELRPSWFNRLLLVTCGVFFLGVAIAGVPDWWFKLQQIWSYRTGIG
jgi:hypothetical protein